ncbi:hypothetical protein JVT61DRAFT_14163 [Boletus reticuloceps]|uniref:Uncharacterized protein n=1 Tax=Boletus reticuloceps TaxID=495285 RepID=A0A8I2YCX9_9AGAM|nr:hypothetical protein JVT61DRAFT_14163 [Boletus reticuloceps]
MWAQPIRHPWFNPPTMKRKLFADDDDASFSSEVSPTPFSLSRRKRVRYNSLERTLAHMTLATTEDVDMWPKISPPCPQETLNVILPSSVEEPGTLPASEPVDMEVEPTLVITDDSDVKSDGWESIASGQLDIKEVQISPAVLECLRRQSRRPPAPIHLPPPTSQALVLYRTPRPPSPKPVEQVHEDREGKSIPTSIHGDDVMEVE